MNEQIKKLGYSEKEIKNWITQNRGIPASTSGSVAMVGFFNRGGVAVRFYKEENTTVENVDAGVTFTPVMTLEALRAWGVSHYCAQHR